MIAFKFSTLYLIRSIATILWTDFTHQADNEDVFEFHERSSEENSILKYSVAEN